VGDMRQQNCLSLLPNCGRLLHWQIEGREDSDYVAVGPLLSRPFLRRRLGLRRAQARLVTLPPHVEHWA